MNRLTPTPDQDHVSASDPSAAATSSPNPSTAAPAVPEDELAKVLQAMNLGQQAIATGNLTVDEEIETREVSAQCSEMLFSATQDPARLSEASDHYQAILRLLKTPSLRRAKFLDRLAYLEMSIFTISKSMKVLDNSIAHSKQARDGALGADDSLLCKIYENLGYSVSQRAQLTNNATDLDIAIACAREILNWAPPDSNVYQKTMVNLAARLHARYKILNESTDAEEALSLLKKQIESFPPGSFQHGSALMIGAYILHHRFEQSKDIEDLDRAIAGFVAGLNSLEKTHERRRDILLQLSTLHNQRYKYSDDIADLEAALEHSRERLHMTPPTYQVRQDHIADYLSHLVEYVHEAGSLDTVQAAAKESRLLRDEVPKTHAKRHSCNLSMAGILFKQFVISHHITHLRELFVHTISSVFEWNVTRDIADPEAPLGGLFHFDSCFRKIESAPAVSPVRKQALAWLVQRCTPIYESRKPFDGLLAMSRDHGWELTIFCNNLTSNLALSQDQIDAEADLLKKQEARSYTDDQERRTSNRQLERDDYTDPIFGHRNLAIDPQRKRVVVSVEQMVKKVLGYEEDEEEPESWADYEAREARLEHESFEKAKREDKFPNPNLCRVCRHVKLLKPMDDGGFTWDTTRFFPFGNYSQLLTRKHCSICRLILSLITVDGGQTLHPRLAQIDREIQGTQFHAQRLPSGEIMLGVEYGMTTVGALRVLKPENSSDALRQPSPLASNSPLEHPRQVLAVLDQGDEEVDFEMIRSWVYECHAGHGELCNGMGNSERYSEEIPLLLVDVQSNRLVQTTSGERYFTLSYVWGKVNISKTMHGNVQERLQKSSLDPSEFPNTIRDAMVLVRSLGERYLWTDALCIVQDDATMKERDIPRMDIVYKMAFANIVALSGDDANAGLPGVLPNFRAPQRIEMLRISQGSSDLALREDADAKIETICMVATAQPLSYAQTSSTWNTRGWILQEQTLARRNIYFSPSYVYFQCDKQVLSEVALEGEYIEEWHEDYGEVDPYEDVDKASTFTIRNPITELRKIRDLAPQENLRLVFKAYSELVEIYSSRNLTQPTDILDAFSGMLSAFNGEFRSETLYGLPIAALDLALLWTPTQSLVGRPGRVSTASPSAPVASPSTSSTYGTLTQNFPTWSWAGWIGGVDYRLLPLTKEPPPDSLVGEFFLVREGKILYLLGYQRPCSDEDAKASPELLGAYFGNMSMEVRRAQKENVLHFMAPFVYGTNFSINYDRDPDYLSSSEHIHLQTRQSVVRIHDKHGKHCGILFEHLDFHNLLRLVEGEAKQDLESIRMLKDKVILAISQTKDAYGDRKDMTRVEGDIKRFDTHEFPARGSGSALVNVLILRKGVGMYERIAIGQIHIKAWKEAGPSRSWVNLG